jgi:hypothetical protein
MDDVEILEQLFDAKILTILKIFIKNDGKQFYLREISKLTRISPASTYRIIKKLESLAIIRLTQIKNLKLYELEHNKKTEFLRAALKTEKRIVDTFVDRVKDLKGVSEIIIQGKEKEDRANLLIIGEEVDSNEIKHVCADLKERFGFMISSLTLNMEQFEQMSSMGLFPGEKKTLYKRLSG